MMKKIKFTKLKKKNSRINNAFKKIKNKLWPDEYSSFNIPEVIMLVIISILFGVIVGCILTYSKAFTVDNSSYESELLSTYQKIRDNYYDEVSEKELLNAAINGMIGALDDPYSYYMDDSATESFNQKIDGNYVGIGTTVLHDENVGNIVTDIFEGSPADKAGVKVGDIFLSIDGTDVRYMSLKEISNYMKGSANTSSNFVFIRDDKNIEVTITRDVVDIPSVSSKIIEGNNKSLGYISIETFASNTYSQFKSNLTSLEKQKIDSLIIDVRNNPGGHLSQVEDILSLFFNKKTVLYQIETKGKVEKVYASSRKTRSYDVVVLINESSASASEILASCFQENYKKATIIGTTSYGKGTVQKSLELSTGASLKYTTEKWLTSKGVWINDKGVVPDIVVEQGEEYTANPSDDNDLQLQKALEILTKNK